MMILRATVASLVCVSLAAAQPSDEPAFTPIGDEALHHISQFYEYDATVPLEIRVIAEEGSNAYARIKLSFRSSHHGRVPAYLGIPKTGPGPFPFVILIHGIGGSKDDWWLPDSFVHGERLTRALLGAGIGVLTLDAEYHGERIAGNGYESAATIPFVHGWANRLRDVVVQSTVECRRGLDVLATRPEVDMDRVGVIGFSMGGMMVFPLMAVDERVKVGVACVPPLGTPAMFNTTQLRAGDTDRVAAIMPYNFLRRLTERPVRVLVGRRDPLYADREVQRLVDLLPSSHKDLVFYDSGHRLPRAYADDAVEWMTRYLLPPR